MRASFRQKHFITSEKLGRTYFYVALTLILFKSGRFCAERLQIRHYGTRNVLLTRLKQQTPIKTMLWPSECVIAEVLEQYSFRCHETHICRCRTQLQVNINVLTWIFQINNTTVRGSFKIFRANQISDWAEADNTINVVSSDFRYYEHIWRLHFRITVFGGYTHLKEA